MVFLYALIGVLGAAATIFTVQNPDPVAVNFLAWRSVAMPLSLLLLLAVFLGLVISSISAFAKQIELKFKLRDSPAHMAMRQGDFGLLRWLDTYVFLIRANGELQRLHRKWLGEDMGALSAM